jgi:large subunit ribosomal protein L18
LQVHLVDDVTGKVLFGKSTLAKDLRGQLKSGGNIAAAAVLGEAFAKEAVSKGIKKICFDRGGYLYHGRVKAFAEAARKAGLEF